jgi:hypothetical protein
VGIDRPDDADESPAEKPERSADQPNAPADHGQQQSRRDQIEPRGREEAWTELRGTVGVEERTEPAGRSEPGARSKTEENAENGQQPKAEPTWEERAQESRWMWGEYKRRWPPEERPPVDRSKDPAGSWRAEGDRYLDPPKNQRIEAECDRIEDREKNEITPALRAIESQDPHRHLVGFDHRLKGRDRIKEKVHDNMNEYGLSPDAAVALVPDAIRFTFQYQDARYTRGVSADIARLEEQGFKLDTLKNYWSDDQYKGINSQWIQPDTGQRFEVQFHTRISREAKEITHPAYERIRTEQADAFEELVLEAFQKKVAAEVPIPPGATDIPDYSKRVIDAR